MTTKSKTLLMRVEDVAEEMRCSTRTVWNRVDAGIYPKPVKDCGSTRWRRTDIEHYVESLATQAAT
ncbi:MAG: AlpA family transcriptional regulator [Rhodobacteraceae bacterium]|nr:AlpA family transcriptional regulator [Paracoccaceae bacterium]MAY47154.1 AlpA family transcriptional regulator [Paracoccaceae bacterium]|tara:strand:- start:361 stop:558 length:198 start_codon:yes stop_codon:yes gene_type:complete